MAGKSYHEIDFGKYNISKGSGFIKDAVKIVGQGGPTGAEGHLLP